MIKKVECDFVVVVRLNRGVKGGGGTVLPPEFFVFPAEVVASAMKGGAWSKVMFKDIGDIEPYRDNWQLVERFLAKRDPRPNSSSKPTRIRRAA